MRASRARQHRSAKLVIASPRCCFAQIQVIRPLRSCSRKKFRNANRRRKTKESAWLSAIKLERRTVRKITLTSASRSRTRCKTPLPLALTTRARQQRTRAIKVKMMSSWIMRRCCQMTLARIKSLLLKKMRQLLSMIRKRSSHLYSLRKMKQTCFKPASLKVTLTTVRRVAVAYSTK